MIDVFGNFLDFGTFVVVEDIVDFVCFGNMRNYIYWKLSGVFVHVFDDVVLLNGNWVDNVFEVFSFTIDMCHWKIKSSSLKHIKVVRSGFALSLRLIRIWCSSYSCSFYWIISQS